MSEYRPGEFSIKGTLLGDASTVMQFLDAELTTGVALDHKTFTRPTPALVKMVMPGDWRGKVKFRQPRMIGLRGADGGTIWELYAACVALRYHASDNTTALFWRQAE